MNGFTILTSSIEQIWCGTCRGLKGKRCTHDVKIRGFALKTERGRHLKRPWDFNYLYLLFNIMNFIVLIAAVVALPSSLRKVPNLLQNAVQGVSKKLQPLNILRYSYCS